MSGMKKLKVDFEFTSKVWWTSGGEDLWNGISEAFDGSEIVIEENLAHSWITEASAIPGWNDGSEFAPHPIAMADVNEDEEF